MCSQRKMAQYIHILQIKSRCKSSPATQQFPVPPLAPSAHFGFLHIKRFDRSSIFTPLWLALIDFHGVRWSGRGLHGPIKRRCTCERLFMAKIMSPWHMHRPSNRAGECSFGCHRTWIHMRVKTQNKIQTSMQLEKCKSDCVKANSYMQVCKYHDTLDKQWHTETHFSSHNTHQLLN